MKPKKFIYSKKPKDVIARIINELANSCKRIDNTLEAIDRVITDSAYSKKTYIIGDNIFSYDLDYDLTTLFNKIAKLENQAREIERTL